MTKKDVQKRVSKDGKPLALNKFSWDSKAKTFSSAEDSLVLDFTGIDGCTFRTNHHCTFSTGHNCTFRTSYGCTFDTSYGCTFKTGVSCTFKTGHTCTFKTGHSCTFKTGVSCTFDTDSTCTFKTSYGCTFKTGHTCTFKTGYSCVVVRRDMFEVYTLNDQIIQLCPYNVPGYVEKGVYSETGKPAIIADGILAEVLAERTKGGLTIRKVLAHGQTATSYLVERNNVFSHGSTLKEAIDDLKYKISDRDTSKYKEHTLAAVLTQEEAIQMYRTITGACAEGTKMFVEGLTTPPEQLTVQELLELTVDQYGNEQLNEFIKEKE